MKIIFYVGKPEMTLRLEPIPSFYQSRNYIPLVNRCAVKSNRRNNVSVLASSAIEENYVNSYFDMVTPERAGILLGEYVLFENGLLAIDRSGNALKINCCREDSNADNKLDALYNSSEFFTSNMKIINGWDNIGLVENPIILSDPYIENYFHFSLEVIPRLRFFNSYRKSVIVIPSFGMTRPFQIDILDKTCKGRVFLPLRHAIRVRDPLVSHSMMSEDGIHWLRDAMAIRAYPGDRRIYIRRSGQGTRASHGGGISESHEFQHVIQKFGFEIVEFGNGDLTSSEQIRLIDGAGILLASHGAALTNLCYSNPPLSVIELMGANVPRAGYMHVSSTLGFHHQAIIMHACDSYQNNIVEIDKLSHAIENAK